MLLSLTLFSLSVSLFLPAGAASLPFLSRRVVSSNTPDSFVSENVSSFSDNFWSETVSAASDLGFDVYGWERTRFDDNVGRNGIFEYSWQMPSSGYCAAFQYSYVTSSLDFSSGGRGQYNVENYASGSLDIVDEFTFDIKTPGQTSGNSIFVRVFLYKLTYSGSSIRTYLNYNYPVVHPSVSAPFYLNCPVIAPRYLSNDEEANALLSDISDYLKNPSSENKAESDRLKDQANSMDQAFNDYADAVQTPPVPDFSVDTSNPDIQSAGNAFSSITNWLLDLPGVNTIFTVAASAMVLSLILFGLVK